MAGGSGAYLNQAYDGDQSSGYKSRSFVSKTRLVLLLLIAVVVGLAIGLLVGKFAICNEDDNKKAPAASGNDGVFLPGVPENLISEEDPDVIKMIQDGIEASRIEENLRDLTRKPHIAGKDADFELVTLMQTRFRESGLLVQTTPYDVLLSYPSEHTPNSVRIVEDVTGTVIYDAADDESTISKEAGVVPPFNAYAPNGLVSGELVYAGYGRVEDFNWLRSQGINVTGKLVIVKYGKIFRGDKVDVAAANGAIGVIIYSDPKDYTGIPSGDERVYPETWWLPPTAAQRGTVFTGQGDPLTPGYPSNTLAFRYPEDEVDPPLPPIPSTPIGYGAAINILQHLGGQEVPGDSDFPGALNITYKLGPGFSNAAWKIQLNVTNHNEIAKAENVFGIIKGTVEPDRYVLFGNHRDAWIYGAIDPSSGTAVMLEVARVMGQLVKDGKWKPRRSIMFCSWGAEEYGLLGSTEWVEQYIATLRERVIAYVNIDIAVQGNDTLRASSTPLMYNIVYDATKKVKNPNPSEIADGRSTVYDTWKKVTPLQDNSNPAIGSLGSGSDYAPILQRAGITSIDIRYSYDRRLYDISSYALYHTEYEIFDVVKNQFDQDFEYHAAVGKVSAEMVRHLADSLVLPFSITNYAKGLETIRQALHVDYGLALKANVSNYDDLKTVIEGFAKDVEDFETLIKNVNKNNPLAVRAVNDQIMLLERAFLEPEGLPSRHLKKHLIFAENANDAYAGSSFPGLVDLLFEIEKEPSRWEQVCQHFSVILHTIQSAGATLRDVTNFMSETL